MCRGGGGTKFLMAISEIALYFMRPTASSSFMSTRRWEVAEKGERVEEELYFGASLATN